MASEGTVMLKFPLLSVGGTAAAADDRDGHVGEGFTAGAGDFPGDGRVLHRVGRRHDHDEVVFHQLVCEVAAPKGSCGGFLQGFRC